MTKTDKMILLASALLFPTIFGAASASAAEIKEPIVCTMEAKLCPDGSYVSRTGPHCEFAPCPGETKGTPPKPSPLPPEPMPPVQVEPGHTPGSGHGHSGSAVPVPE
ncbi:MAG: hypothetical protein H6858_04015 [Rhodospirillales bacterium]|nr:hypothetical protein [Alphaproteobacteria bacterium]MCB9976752.1 hypothetical protein [Rhodospirillales bacterium]